MDIERSHVVDGSVVIASSGTVSTAIQTVGFAFGSITLPAAFTGTALTFQTSSDDSTYVAAYDDEGTQITIGTVAASRRFRLPNKLFPANYIKIVSGSSEGAERTIGVELEG